MISIRFENFITDEGVLLPAGDKRFAAVSVDGHSQHGKKGFDIICAAVSALSHTLIASITRIGDIEQEWVEADGHLSTVIDISAMEEEKKNSIDSGDIILHWCR